MAPTTITTLAMFTAITYPMKGAFEDIAVAYPKTSQSGPPLLTINTVIGGQSAYLLLSREYFTILQNAANGSHFC